MALHVRGVVLPDDEVRDLWLDGDRVSFRYEWSVNGRPVSVVCGRRRPRSVFMC